MSKTTPKAQGVIGYKQVFNSAAPADRLSLLQGIDKATVIGEIAALKYRLQPKEHMYHDYSWETQKKEFVYFLGSRQDLISKYKRVITEFERYPGVRPIIFTRQTCLFALEELIASDLPDIPGFTMEQSWKNLFKYLLAVNEEITKLPGNARSTEDLVKSLESLNPAIVPLAELSVEIDPIFSITRGYALMEYLSKHPEVGSLFNEYMQDTYQMPYDQFIYEVTSMLMANNIDGVGNIHDEVSDRVLDVSFFYQVQPKDEDLFETLSKRIPVLYPERLISIKKYPFYKGKQGEYFLVDPVLLREKCYSQLINDFWFDKIKPAVNADGTKYMSIDRYRSVIGYFFEHYLKSVIQYSFQNGKYFVVKLFDELKLKNAKKQEIELADVYIRDKKRVFVGQVKTTGLYDTEKYAGDINAFYKNNRNAFFKSFGIDQLVESIKNLEELAPKIDKSFPAGKGYHIYPAIIVNEKAMQTPLMAEIFNIRFRELIEPYLSPKVSIYPVTVIHINDWERMQGALHKMPGFLWDLLDYNRRDIRFIPPFYNTLDIQNVKPDHYIAMPLYEHIIDKHQKKTIH